MSCSTSCSRLGAATGQVSKCLGCLEKASKVACSTVAFPQSCWNPETAGDVCKTCASTAADYSSCVNCITSRPYSDSCSVCGSLTGQALQASCYGCVKAAASPFTGCSDCLSYLKDAKAQEQCLSCMTNPQTTSAGRQWVSAACKANPAWRKSADYECFV